MTQCRGRRFNKQQPSIAFSLLLLLLLSASLPVPPYHYFISVSLSPLALSSVECISLPCFFSLSFRLTFRRGLLSQRQSYVDNWPLCCCRFVVCTDLLLQLNFLYFRCAYDIWAIIAFSEGGIQHCRQINNQITLSQKYGPTSRQ